MKHTIKILDDVSVVVLCHNRLEEVLLNIPPRIADVYAHRLELIVVDNASTDGTRDALRTLHNNDPCFDLVLNEKNLGVGAGRNSGWDRTRRPYIVILDEDTRITTEQLCALVDALRAAPKVGIVTPVMYHPLTGRRIGPVLSHPYKATNFLGACYATRRNAVTSPDAHDPDCDFGGEELDLSIRIRNAGFEVLQIPELRVAHNGIQRNENDLVPLLRRERWTRNHARVVWRSFPYFHAAVWSSILLAGQLRACLRRGAHAEVIALIKAWMEGVAQGIKMHQPVKPSVTKFYANRLGVGALFKKMTR